MVSPSDSSAPVASDIDASAVNSAMWFESVVRHASKLPELRIIQRIHGFELMQGRDVLLASPTGSGKSLFMLSPVIAAQARGEAGIAFLVVPTKALAVQHAELVKKLGLRGLALTQETVRQAAVDKHNLFADLQQGYDVRVAVMSPQMLTQSEGITALLKQLRFRNLVRWMLIDEIHLFEDSTTVFYGPYQDIAPMRDILPHTTVWAAASGTLTPSHISKKVPCLQLLQGDLRLPRGFRLP
ncbi:P-loop containing nucleoside triphosphate hydrolase protein [Lentinula raphanica]|nr:P-loop containing nucleoside triphosphate hydrolase protein [Lentinula raphanica]